VCAQRYSVVFATPFAAFDAWARHAYAKILLPRRWCRLFFFFFFSTLMLMPLKPLPDDMPRCHAVAIDVYAKDTILMRVIRYLLFDADILLTLICFTITLMMLMPLRCRCWCRLPALLMRLWRDDVDDTICFDCCCCRDAYWWWALRACYHVAAWCVVICAVAYIVDTLFMLTPSIRCAARRYVVSVTARAAFTMLMLRGAALWWWWRWGWGARQRARR